MLFRSFAKFNESAKPDFLDLDNDGDTDEPMKDAAKDAEPAKSDKSAVEKRKRLQALKDKQEEKDADNWWDKEDKKSSTRSVKGKSYGGAAQKDDEEKDDLDESGGPYELYNPKHPRFASNYKKFKAKNPDAKLADFREYLQREGLQEPGVVKEESEVNFLARLRDRIVNRGMAPLIETPTANPYRVYEAADTAGVGGRAKGIEHLEDWVFRMGPEGIAKALAIVTHAETAPGMTTAKWDGKPAIIWGRKPTGEFVLTDKSGFGAKGYDGMATSPQMLERIMRMRSGERGELIDIYTKLWPMLERATPKNFTGYKIGRAHV